MNLNDVKLYYIYIIYTYINIKYLYKYQYFAEHKLFHVSLEKSYYLKRAYGEYLKQQVFPPNNSNSLTIIKQHTLHHQPVTR